MTRITCGLTGAVLLSACGAPGTVNGTVAGLKLNVADAVFTFSDNVTGESKQAFILLTDKPHICDALAARRLPKGQTKLGLSLFHNGEELRESFVPGTGDFMVVPFAEGSGEGGRTYSRPVWAQEPGRKAFGAFQQTDDSCEDTISMRAGQAVSGLIKVTELKEKETMSGTFNLSFESGDTVTGSFNASYCDTSTLLSRPSCE